MQYHLIVMELAEYSSSYSLFVCHTKLATSILTLLKLSNISKPLCSLLTLAHNILHSPSTSRKSAPETIQVCHVDLLRKL